MYSRLTWSQRRRRNDHPVFSLISQPVQRQYNVGRGQTGRERKQMHPTLERLLAAGPTPTDGAWGTQLQRLGLPLGACPDAWNLTHPELVHQVAADYVAADSRVILTNTFGANRLALERYGLADQAARITRAGRGPSLGKPPASGAAVFASIGPQPRCAILGVRWQRAGGGYHKSCVRRAGPGDCRLAGRRHCDRNDVRTRPRRPGQSPLRAKPVCRSWRA